MRKIDAYRKSQDKYYTIDNGVFKPLIEDKTISIPLNPKKIIPKGCQEFDINGHKIIALSYKRALVKYNKLNN